MWQSCCTEHPWPKAFGLLHNTNSAEQGALLNLLLLYGNSYLLSSYQTLGLVCICAVS
uniref:Uncharacterized protein n=1 Tax=Anguilla anguilla TaxID=7936 RepID=A0A0E9WGM6_ANGAN